MWYPGMIQTYTSLITNQFGKFMLAYELEGKRRSRKDVANFTTIQPVSILEDNKLSCNTLQHNSLSKVAYAKLKTITLHWMGSTCSAHKRAC